MNVFSILDVDPDQVLYLSRRAIQIKHAAADPQSLRGRSVGIYFRQVSTRTRTSFTIGAGRLGATVMPIGPYDLQLATGETLADTARVLAGYLDLLVIRTNESVDEMKVFGDQPGLSVINALSADEHPTQALADLATLLEHFGGLDDLSLLYCGDGNKTAAALALAMSRLRRAHVTFATPAGYGLPGPVLERAQSLAAAHDAVVEEIHDLGRTPACVDVVYASRWQEMGVGKAEPQWKRCFEPFRVTRALFDRVAGARTVFMHDLPAVRGEEVDAEVLDGPRSLVWEQARHKLFSAMAVMEWCQRSGESGPPS